MSDKIRIALIWEDNGVAKAIAPADGEFTLTDNLDFARRFESADAARQEAMQMITESNHEGSTSMIICSLDTAQGLIGTTPEYHHATRLPARLSAGMPGRMWVV